MRNIPRVDLSHLGAVQREAFDGGSRATDVELQATVLLEGDLAHLYDMYSTAAQ